MSDLVEKLRLKTYTPIEDVEVMIEQAADRIEAQDQAIANMVDCRTADYERIEALEAALRRVRDDPNACSCGDFAKEIARRALEGKHE